MRVAGQPQPRRAEVLPDAGPAAGLGEHGPALGGQAFAPAGATPLAIAPGNHFRAGFVGFSYRYVGKLSIKKPGCETWSTEVNDAILSKDIHARLKCDPNYQPAAAPLPVQPAGTAAGDQTIERLERIEALRKKGLISEDEYKRLRARIIEKL